MGLVTLKDTILLNLVLAVGVTHDGKIADINQGAYFDVHMETVINEKCDNLIDTDIKYGKHLNEDQKVIL